MHRLLQRLASLNNNARLLTYYTQTRCSRCVMSRNEPLGSIAEQAEPCFFFFFFFFWYSGCLGHSRPPGWVIHILLEGGGVCCLLLKVQPPRERTVDGRASRSSSPSRFFFLSWRPPSRGQPRERPLRLVGVGMRGYATTHPISTMTQSPSSRSSTGENGTNLPHPQEGVGDAIVCPAGCHHMHPAVPRWGRGCKTARCDLPCLLVRNIEVF